MNFKKITGMILSCALAGTIFAGCGDDNKVEDTKIGMITHLNASEQKMNEILQKAQEKAGIKITSHVAVFYDNLNSLQMALEANNVQEMSTYKSVANYLTGQSGKFEIIPDHPVKLKDSFCFAVLKSNTDLKNQLDKALEELKADGTLEKLTGRYITNLKPGEEPPAVAFENIPGAATLRVAITGDLPPLDLVLANGQPAGFNTALLAEIGKKLNRNVEVVNIDSAARATALSSDKVDVIFWAILPDDDTRPADIDMPENVELTVPYFTDDIVHVDLKK